MPKRKVLDRKVLTIYGDRGWNPAEASYTQSSMVRGFAGLNGHIHRLMRDNPEIVVYSVSHSSIVYPFGLDNFMLRLFATVVYSGEIHDISGFATFAEDEEKPRKPFDDGEMGYGTVIRVQL